MQIDEIEKELLAAARDTRIRLAREKGYLQAGARDVVVEMMEKQRELFQRACDVEPMRFVDTVDVALWLEEKIVATGGK